MRTRLRFRGPPASSTANGLDDVLQTIRVSYSGAGNVGHVRSDVLGIPTGRISMSEPSLVARFLLSSLHSRAPPLS